MPRFSVGINYWPRRSAMWMWTTFDGGEIDDDFARIAALGLDTVRFFLLWEAFQPEPERIDTAMLDRLIAVLDRAEKHGLRAIPTLFTGHMSGVNFVPRWALDAGTPSGRFRTIARGEPSPYGCGDFYREPLLSTQRFAAREIGRAARGHRAVEIWDLGNEFSNLREPLVPADAATWSAILSQTLEDASGVGATGGLHGEDLSRDRNIRPSSIARPWKIVTMHGYPVYSEFARSRLDACVCPFLATLVRDFSRKPVLFSEFGNPTCPPGKLSPYEREPLPDEPPPPQRTGDDFAPYACLSEAEMASYAYETLDRLYDAGALGGLWWCWADYVPALASRPPFDRAKHELSFGIIRSDGTEKPVARALSGFAREARETAVRRARGFDEDDHYAGLPSSIITEYSQFVHGDAR